jgi:hypothetical protein
LESSKTQLQTLLSLVSIGSDRIGTAQPTQHNVVGHDGQQQLLPSQHQQQQRSVSHCRRSKPFGSTARCGHAQATRRAGCGTRACLEDTRRRRHPPPNTTARCRDGRPHDRSPTMVSRFGRTLCPGRTGLVLNTINTNLLENNNATTIQQ